jgi:hypothetical protein
LAVVCKLSAARIAALREVATAAGLPEAAVVFTGFVSDEDLVGLVRHATLLVYPSLYEGLGLPVLEAYACGTPVVGSDTSSIAELVLPELACDPRQPEAVAAAMGRLVASPTLRERSLAFGRRLLADPAYAGFESQVLDNTDAKYKGLKDWQYHGSLYGVTAATCRWWSRGRALPPSAPFRAWPPRAWRRRRMPTLIPKTRAPPFPAGRRASPSSRRASSGWAPMRSCRWRPMARASRS